LTQPTHVQLYDTTLRDGAQQGGISFSVEDKLKIAARLDELGIHYIEGGWPASNPKDAEFFRRAGELRLSRAALVAFGSTRKPRTKPSQDANLEAILEAETKTATLVGKSWDSQVTLVLETSLQENVAMISESVDFLKSRGLEVFFDAEHFFDGYKSNAEYALETVRVAGRAGASCIVLCDTNGGTLPQEIASMTAAAKRGVSASLGIHAHNDGELAVANSLMAVMAGAVQVQGTINGYGERCGNANLCSIIPALELKMGVPVLGPERLKKLTEVARFVSELANLRPFPRQPYVGARAFAHKAGLHVAGMNKWEESYQHIDPDAVGNRSGVLVSELSGVGNIVYKARERGLPVPQGDEARRILEQVKLLEGRGFQYEEAEASFELLVHRAQPDHRPPFELVDFMVVIESRRRPAASGGEVLAEAMVKVKVGDQVMHTASEGDGPVNALDIALRKALTWFYPGVAQVKLVDYKVRILEETAGTESQVRVLIESSDGESQWRTVGSSSNIIQASWLALADSLEYWLLKKSAK
jgi:2-isopropylmalate synthase